MIKLLYKYIFELHDYTSNCCADIGIELGNNECRGQWKLEATQALKEQELRLKELKQCLGFLERFSRP